MRIRSFDGLSIVSYILLAVILAGAHNPLLYITATIAISFLVFMRPIHFIWLMLFDTIANYELNNPSTLIGGINYYHTDIFIFAAAYFLLVRVLGRGSLRFPGRIRAAFFLFLFIVFLGVLNGLVNGVAPRNLMRELSAFGGYLFVPVAASAFRTTRDIKQFARRIAWMGLFLALLGITMRILGIENTTGFPGSAGVSTAIGTQSRAYGLSGGTSFMIASLFLLISSSNSLIRSAYRRASTVFVVFTQVLLLFARSLMVGVASGFAMLALASGTRKAISSIALIVLALLPLYVFSSVFQTNLGSAVSDRYLSVLSTRYGGERAQANITRRTNEFSELWARLNWKERVIGLGMGSRLSITVLDQTEVQVFHNSYANCIQKVGMIGLLIYVLLMFSIVRQAMRLKQNRNVDDELYRLGIGFVATFTALAIWGSGAMGMPMNANLLACVSLGIFIRTVLILRKDQIAS
ncbi:MAG: hypothetical protein JXK93_08510 [Sphaerochaetaceae bacterium]|nr:hypothetical protein [Sphaerochaetaceae bacterium]